MQGWFRRHPVTSFYIFAYVYSWAITLPLALQGQGVIPVRLPLALHYLSAFGPACAALTLTKLLRQCQVSDREMASPGIRRPSCTWLAVGALSPLLLFMLARLAARVVGQPAPGWTALGHVNFLPDLGFGAWGLWFCTSGLGEEIGWRGFALPRLQRTHSALMSSLLLGMAWAAWHLPAFFYVPSYGALGLRMVPGFFLGVLAGAIVLTWLYNSSGGSILTVALWHASFNFVSASPHASGLVAAVTSTLVMVWAAVLLWRYGPATLTTRSVRDGAPATAGQSEAS